MTTPSLSHGLIEADRAIAEAGRDTPQFWSYRLRRAATASAMIRLAVFPGVRVMSESVALPLTSATTVQASPTTVSRGIMIDWLLVVLPVVYAFLAGSFVARNSDVFRHLAGGRLIAQGDYRFGADPFSYTTSGVYWANHAWLFDLGLYLAWFGLGYPGLVAVKALVSAAVVCVMLLTCRGTGPAGLATGCVLLAVFAASPRFLLQPTVASYFLLAACLYSLKAGGRFIYAVPILIALWVNLDSWFLLGPLLVLLFGLGRWLERGRTDRGQAERPQTRLKSWPRWFLPACLGACLLSPHHVHALCLPTELSPAVWSSGFPSDPRFAGLFDSLGQSVRHGMLTGHNLASGALLVLLAVGLFSFAVRPVALRSWRATVWIPFALLAAWQVRLVPFFAVVAAPISALNLSEFLAHCRCQRLGRTAAGLLGLALIGYSLFGGALGLRSPERDIAWDVHIDPGLLRGVQGIADWRMTSGVREGNVFTAHPDLAHYLAWFSPDRERAFLDSRFSLFTTVYDGYQQVSRGLGLLGEGWGRADDVVTKHDLVAAWVYDPDPTRMTQAVRTTAQGLTGPWRLARIDGNSLLLVSERVPRQPSEFDADRAALTSQYLPPAGKHPPTLVDAPTNEWFPFRSSTPAYRRGTAETGAATIHLRLFEAAPTASPILPLVAVRSARIATEGNPSDPTAWLVLARGYLTLTEQTVERDVGEDLTLLQTLRLVQTTAALTQSIIHGPNTAAAHETLAVVLTRRNALDLAQRHSGVALRLMRRAGPLPGETAESFAERVQKLAAAHEELEAAVFNAENRFLVRSFGLSGDPLLRAKIAAEQGLPQKAIDVLLASHPDLYGGEGLSLLADLLLQTGQAAACRHLLDREELRQNPDALGVVTIPGKPHPSGHRWAYRLPAYDWYDFCQCAAAGNYSGATAAIDRLAARLDQLEQTSTSYFTGLVLRQLQADLAFALPPTGPLARLAGERERQQLVDYLGHSKFFTVARADLLTLAGILDLERGMPESARTRFATARQLYDSRRDIAPSLPGERHSARYQQAIRQQHWP